MLMSKAKNRMAKSRRKLAAQQTRPRQHDPYSEPPAELIEFYMDVARFTEANPVASEMIAAMTDQEIASLITGIAWADEFGYREEQCLDNALLIKRWSVMNSYVYLFDWDDPIGIMTEQQIVDHARADRAAGIIPDPRLND